jgi:hypothetical protein
MKADDAQRVAAVSPHHAPETCGAVSARAFAARHGLRWKTIVKWCQAGRICGARKHPLTRQWWIYPPAKLLFP